VTLAPPLILRLQYALTAAAGALDVFCVTRLGGAFASVITGNLVQVGSSVVGSDPRLAVRCLVAVTAYAIGVACGAAALRRVPQGWTSRTTLVTAAEFVVLAAVAAIWRATFGHAGEAAKELMLGLASLAMGLQSASTVTSGLRGAATTYFTGTLTNAVRTLVTESHGLARGARAALRLASLLAGALAGGLLQQLAPAWAPVLPAAVVAAVALLPLAPARPPR
jgi:uncharacterized membrane protein YoaK (UPF0700 family)